MSAGSWLFKKLFNFVQQNQLVLNYENPGTQPWTIKQCY